MKPGPWGHIAAVLLVALAVAVPYCVTLDFPYVFDDHINILSEAGIRDLGVMYSSKQQLRAHGTHPLMYHHFHVRAVPFLSFWANYRLGGYWPVWRWRAVNIALHAVMGWLVYALTVLLMRMPRLRSLWDESAARAAALGASLLFVLHPLATETVIYISGRVGQTAAVFYVAAVAGYLGWRTSGRRVYYTLSIICGMLGMFSKETVFTMPLMIVAVEWMFGEGGGRRRWASVLPYLLMLPIMPVTKLALVMGDASLGEALDMGSRFQSSIPRHEYLLTQFTVVVRYIKLIFLPFGQVADYAWPLMRSPIEPRVIASLAALTAIVCGGLWALTRGADRPAAPLAALAVFGFFLTISVESSVFPVVILIAEYRTYLPMAFVAPALGAGLAVVAGRGGAGRYYRLLAAILIPLALVTVARFSAWRSNEAFWQDVLRKSPVNVRANLNLAIEYMDRGDYQRALPLLQRAVRLDAESYEAHNYLAEYYLATGDIQRAAAQLDRSLSINGRMSDTLVLYARANRARGRLAEAAANYSEAIESNRFSIGYGLYETHAELGDVLAEAGDYAGALEHYSFAAGDARLKVRALLGAGRAHMGLGRKDDALAAFDAVIALEPANTEARRLIVEARAIRDAVSEGSGAP